MSLIINKSKRESALRDESVLQRLRADLENAASMSMFSILRQAVGPANRLTHPPDAKRLDAGGQCRRLHAK